MKKISINKFTMEQLEPRLMFSADVQAVPFDGDLPYEDGMADFSVIETGLLPNSSKSCDSVGAEHERHELFFIDSGVPDYQQLVDDLTARNDGMHQVDVVLLDSSRDGIEQISKTLARYRDIDAVHVVSHGRDGAVQLGNALLTQDSLDDYADSIEGWRDALTGKADILFYGCDLAAGEEGRNLINSLTFLTGADVAASDDPTGAEIKGGDWDFEYKTGLLESTVAFSEQVQQVWKGSLDMTSFQQGNNGYAGTQDTWIDEANPDSSYGNDNIIIVESTVSQNKVGMIRFDNIFGSGPNQIPWGSTINSATLQVYVHGGGSSSASADLYIMLTNWSEASTWNTMGNGIQTDDVEGSSTPDATINSLDITGYRTFTGLESTLQAWSHGATNYGWAVIQTENNNWDFDASENGNSSHVPLLTVDYTPPQELPVNTETAGEQKATDIATDGVGNFVVVWESEGQDGSGSGIYAQRFDSTGAPIGNEFRVNVTTSGNQEDPQIAMDDAGNFVITWASEGQDGDAATETNIYASVYDSTGTLVKGEFLVNQTTADSQATPSVAMEGATGEIMIAWAGFDSVGSDEWDIYARRFDVTGTALAGEIMVNTTTANDQIDPDVDVDTTAEFSVVWTGYGQDGDLATEGNIYVQNYRTGGAPRGGEILVNDTTTSGHQHSAAIARQDDGDYTIVWVSEGQDGDGAGIFADNIAFGGSGNNKLGVIQVNATTAGDQTNPDIAVEPLGNIVFTWESAGQDGDGPTETNVYARLFEVTNSSILPFGGEILVNTTTSGNQERPAVAADDEDDFVIAWSENGTGDSDGVFARVFEDMLTNNAPEVSLANPSISYTENNAPVAIDASLTVSDPDDTFLAGATVSFRDGFAVGQDVLSFTDQLGIFGSYDSGTGILTLTGASTVADYQTALRTVTYHNTSDDPDTAMRIIEVKVDDGVSSSSDSRKINVSAENDVPAATNLSAPETYTEDVPLDLVDIVVTDPDSANVTVTLTLSDTAAGSLSTGTSGAVTSNYNAISGVWTASGAIVDVNALLAGVTFNPALNYNSNFTIATSVDDGVASPVTGTKTMTGVPQNNAPTATNLNAPESYTEDIPLNLTDIVVSDVDSANVTVTLTLSDVAAGSLSTGTSGAVTSNYNAVSGVWIASGAIADVNTLLAGVTFTPSLNYTSNFTIATSVDDGIAPAITGVKNMTCTPQNDAPTATSLNAPEIFTEDTQLNLTDIVVSDVDNANVTVTLTLSDVAAGSLSTGTSGAVTSTFVAGVWTASGAIADVNTLLAGVTFNPALYYDNNFTIATSVDDGIAPAITGVKNMTCTPQNDAPTATNLSAPETYTEDTPLNLTDIVTSDVDSANVTVTLTLSDVAAGSLSTGTSGAVTSTFAGGVWTASGAIADVNALLAGVTFNPALNYDSNFTIATSVDDGIAPAITGVKNMTCTPQNDAPTATNLSAPETYTEDTPLNLTDIIVSDVDSTNVTVTLTLSDVAAGSLSTGTSGAVTSTFVAGVWTASGAIADVNTLLAGVTFTPALNYDSNFTIGTSVDDGIAPAITGVKNMTCTPQNDAPTATNLNAGETYTEDTPLNLTDIVVSDVDSANVTVTLTLPDVAAGSLSTGTSGAVTSTFVAGVWTASGAIADVNTLLSGVTFNPSLNYNNNFTIAVCVVDGVAPVVMGVKDMSGRPVGDTPQVDNSTTLADTQSGLIIINRNASDGAEVTHFRISGITNGTLYLADGVTQINDGDYITVAQGLAGVRFTPTAKSIANGSFAVESSEDGVSVAAQSGVVTSVITVITPPPEEPAETGNPEPEELEEPMEDTLPDVPVTIGDTEAVPAAPSPSEGGELTSVNAADDSSKNGGKDKAPEKRDDPDKAVKSPHKWFRNDTVISILNPEQNILQKIINKPVLANAYEHLRNSLDAIKKETDKDIQLNRTVVGSAITASTSLSVGYVVWLVRGGTLLSSVLSSMPAWQIADPLPILTKTKDEEDSDDKESLESIIRKGSRNSDKKENNDNSASSDDEFPKTDH